MWLRGKGSFGWFVLTGGRHVRTYAHWVEKLLLPSQRSPGVIAPQQTLWSWAKATEWVDDLWVQGVQMFTRQHQGVKQLEVRTTSTSSVFVRPEEHLGVPRRGVWWEGASTGPEVVRSQAQRVTGQARALIFSLSNV